MVLQESDDEKVEKTPTKRMKTVHKSESTRKRTCPESNETEDRPTTTRPKRTKSLVKGKPLSSLADSTASARKRRTKRNDERTLTSKAPLLSSITDLFDRAIESAISFTIAFA